MVSHTVLGIDPASRVVGCGLVKVEGSHLSYRWSYTMDLGDRPKAYRLFELSKRMADMLTRHRPDAMAIESGYVGPGRQSSLVLAEARGVIIAEAVKAAVRVIEVSPSEGKRAAGVKGNAEKSTVARAVRAIFGLTHEMTLDECDALSLALAGAGRL